MAALSEEEYDLLSFLEQYYLTNSALPSVEVASSIHLDEVLYIGALKKVEFRNALVSRGVPDKAISTLVPLGDGPVGAWKNYALSEKQLLCANVILDTTDNRSRRKKLSELGIKTQEYETWMRDPVFSGYLRSRAEALLGDNQHESHLALVDRVKAGDVSAIKYYNEMTGRYVQASARGANGSSGDVKMILLRVVEVLQRHLEPDKLQLVAGELLALAEGGQLDAPLIATPITRPSRERSPVGDLMPVKGEVLVGPIAPSKVSDAL